MAKYIFCILFGIFLIWGCNLVPDKELQEFRTEAGTTTIQSHNKSQSYRSKAVVKQSGKENNSFQEGKYDGKYDCNIADGILGNSLLSRTTSLSKILRFNVSSVTIRILSSLKYQFPKEKWTGLPYYTNLTKFSYPHRRTYHHRSQRDCTARNHHRQYISLFYHTSLQQERPVISQQLCEFPSFYFGEMGCK